MFVDGVRYSNGAQRGGVNTFLDLIEPGSLEAIEIVRGPSSAQYGSDALGGSIQFLSRAAAASAAGPARVFGGSAGAGGRHRAPRSAAARRFVSMMTRSRSASRRRSAAAGSATDPARRRHRFARRGDAVPRRAVRRADGRPAARHRLRPARRVDPRALGARAPRRSRAQLHAHDAGRRQALRPAARRRRQPDLRAERPVAGSVLRRASSSSAPAGSTTRTVTYSLNSQREERVNQGGNGNPTRDHRPRARADDRARRAGVGRQAAVAAPDADRRRRRLLRAAHLGLVQRQPRHRRDLGASAARAGRRVVHAGRRLRADRRSTCVPIGCG